MLPGWVYPRACGGTASAAVSGSRTQGLSPRVRGNHHDEAENNVLMGSIPARAGEPRTHSLTTPPRKVYPRACGGTDIAVKRSPFG